MKTFWLVSLLTCLTACAITNLPDPDRDAKLYQSTVPGLPVPGGKFGGLYQEVGWPKAKTQEELVLLQQEIDIRAKEKLDNQLLALAKWSWIACGLGIFAGLILIGYAVMTGPTAKHLVKPGIIIVTISVVAVPIFYFLAQYTAKIAAIIAIGLGSLVLIGVLMFLLKNGISSGHTLWNVFSGLQKGKEADRESWEKIKGSVASTMSERAKAQIDQLKGKS